jgi:uncharacterized protein YndB with AHSA1/START domain
MAVTSSTDKIEKRVVLKAPQARVWRAISDAGEFGTWFQMRFESPFAEGTAVKAQVLVPGYEHVTAEFEIVRISPQDYFAYRWHPYAVDPKVDYSGEPMTLVEFRLDDVPGGTKLSVVESGFDQLPAHRRDEAFRMNDAGWKAQLENVRKYVEV